MIRKSSRSRSHLANLAEGSANKGDKTDPEREDTADTIAQPGPGDIPLPNDIVTMTTTMGNRTMKKTRFADERRRAKVVLRPN
jgi:hypothetical protein